MLRFVVVLVAFSTARGVRSRPAPDAGVARQPGAVQPRCYRADRPLGTDAGSVRRRVTPGQPTTFRLLDSGRVDRPGTFGAAWWAHGSRWERVGDSLRVRLATGTAGWALRLVATPAGSDSAFVGVARYLSDAIVRESVPDTAWWRASPPVMRTVRVSREPCGAPAQRGGATAVPPSAPGRP